MVHLTRIYTKTGDEGFTDLANRTRTFKTDPVIEAIGAVDEANSAIGLIPYSDIVERIQNDLFDLGADLARSELKINEDRIKWLENVIDDMNQYLDPLRSFTITKIFFKPMRWQYSSMLRACSFRTSSSASNTTVQISIMHLCMGQ